MRATPALAEEAAYSERELLLGPCLIHDRAEDAQSFLRHRRQMLLDILQQMEKGKQKEASPQFFQVESELFHLQDVLMEDDGWDAGNSYEERGWKGDASCNRSRCVEVGGRARTL